MSQPWIMTVTGKRFYFDEPTPDMIDIQDIAHALSNICRYTGHASMFYSVAEHSVHVAEEVSDERLRLTALLHDACEAYVSDLSAPLRRHHLLSGYNKLEKDVWRAVSAKFSLPSIIPKEVKRADRQLLVDEACVMWGRAAVDAWELDVEPVHRRLHFYDPFRAKIHFLSAYNRYK